MESEARDLAQTFVKSLCAVPVKSRKHPRAALIDKLKPFIGGILDGCLASQPDVMPIQSGLANRFQADPTLPGKIWAVAEDWGGSDWARPFWLVLRDELKEIDRSRS